MTEATSRKPTHDILLAEENGNDSFYTPLGAAWMHKDQGGMNLQFKTFPTRLDRNSRIIIRVRKEKPKAEDQQ